MIGNQLICIAKENQPDWAGFIKATSFWLPSSQKLVARATSELVNFAYFVLMG
jgi:hypothetical protein